MNLLLDAHTLLWLMEASPNLSAAAESLIAAPSNRLYLSMASIWEMAIKIGLKKITRSVPFATFLATAASGYGLIVLPITTADCIAYESLPFPDPRYRDPFDRMIVTLARRNNLSVIGADRAFDSYGIARLW